MNKNNRRAALLVAAALLGSTGAASAADSGDPIKLTLHDWTGQLITTRLMGEALKAAGNNVEYAQWSGLFVPAGTPEPVVQRLRDAARPWRDALSMSPPVSPPASFEGLGDYLFDLGSPSLDVPRGRHGAFLRAALSSSPAARAGEATMVMHFPGVNK